MRFTGDKVPRYINCLMHSRRLINMRYYHLPLRKRKYPLIKQKATYFLMSPVVQTPCWLSACVYSVAQSCPALWDPMDCSPPVSPVHGIFQAGVLEWVAISCSGDLPNPWIEFASLASAGRFFTTAPPGIHKTFSRS